MNQEKIGKFITECRKEQGLTQAQLAEKLGITNQAVSKWENAKSMPDVSIMIELAQILDISVNELMIGERIEMKDYREQADKNIVSLMMSLKQLKKVDIALEVLIGFGIALTVFSFMSEIELMQKIVFSIIGIFTWILGFYLHVKVMKTINTIEDL